jgi:hypothetical protein
MSAVVKQAQALNFWRCCATAQDKMGRVHASLGARINSMLIDSCLGQRVRVNRGMATLQAASCHHRCASTSSIIVLASGSMFTIPDIMLCAPRPKCFPHTSNLRPGSAVTAISALLDAPFKAVAQTSLLMRWRRPSETGPKYAKCRTRMSSSGEMPSFNKPWYALALSNNRSPPPRANIHCVRVSIVLENIQRPTCHQPK